MVFLKCRRIKISAASGFLSLMAFITARCSSMVSLGGLTNPSVDRY